MKLQKRGILGVLCMVLVFAGIIGFSAAAKAAALPAVKLKEAKATEDDTIVVTWTEVEGAVGYRVYRRYGSTGWKRIAEIEPAVKYEDKTAKPATEYHYTVRALDSSKQLGGYDATGVKATVELRQPKLIGVITKDSKKLQVMWEKVNNVPYYYVYRAQPGDKLWTCIASKVKDTRYIDETAKEGISYKYTVRSAIVVGNKIVKSDYKATLTGKLNADGKITVPAVKLIGASSVGVSGIAVSWESLPQADGYFIYRKTSSGWSRKGMVSGYDTTTWTDTKVTAGKTYKYTVRAYITSSGKKTLSSTWDSKGVSAVCALAAPELVSADASYSSGTITLTWKKVEGADGYAIYRKTSSSGWKRKGFTKELKYVDKTASKNVEYTYTVRAYIVKGSKKKLGLYDKTGIKAKATITKKTVDGLELFYDSDGKLITNTETILGIIGERSSYKAEVDYNKNVVTLYAKGSSGSYNLPVRACICSTGTATPIGTHYTSDSYRWHELNGPCWGQWCTRIVNGVLFHSVYYNTYNNNMDLSVSAYNKLGTQASHGCVRLTARDAKWIYDNCQYAMPVKVSTSCANPFGKPSAYKLASSHTWDPTDPTAYYKCEQKGCH